MGDLLVIPLPPAPGERILANNFLLHQSSFLNKHEFIFGAEKCFPIPLELGKSRKYPCRSLLFLNGGSMRCDKRGKRQGGVKNAVTNIGFIVNDQQELLTTLYTDQRYRIQYL